MSVHAYPDRIRWIVAAAGAVAVMIILAPLLMLPRLPSLSPAIPPAPRPIKLADPNPENALVREDMAMHDLAPLFLPTERNATLTRIPRMDIGRTLLDLETAKLSLAQSELHFDRDLPPAPGLNGKPVTAATPLDALSPLSTESSMVGFGRSTVPMEPLPARGGYLEVVAASTGEHLFAKELDPDAKPRTEKAWGPVQFMASVGPAGLLGPLILTERSGAEEVDQHFRNFLAQTYRIGQRLPPGIYRITVGP